MFNPRNGDMWVTCRSCRWVACFASTHTPVTNITFCGECGSLLSWKTFTKTQTRSMFERYNNRDFYGVFMNSKSGQQFMGSRSREDLSVLIRPDKNEIEYWRE